MISKTANFALIGKEASDGFENAHVQKGHSQCDTTASFTFDKELE